MPKIAEIEDTPNPNAVKFTLHEPLTWGVTHSYENAEQAAGDALASELFDIEHVSNVFYVDRWLTVTQDGEADWPDLVRLIAVPLRAAPAAAFQSAATVAAFWILSGSTPIVLICGVTSALIVSSRSSSTTVGRDEKKAKRGIASPFF